MTTHLSFSESSFFGVGVQSLSVSNWFVTSSAQRQFTSSWIWREALNGKIIHILTKTKFIFKKER